jgi:phosphoribosylanthranilate isomerase
MTFPVIQIAGIRNWDEAAMISRSGATHIGFPLRLDIHPPDLSEVQAADIIRRLPPAIRPVLITYLAKATEIYELTLQLGCTIVQLHGSVSVSELDKLRRLSQSASIEAPFEIWKSLVIKADNEPELLQTLHSTTPFVDAYISDTYDAVTGASGATGKTHDWRVTRRIVAQSSRPVIVAGGLNPGNVAEAIRITGAAGVDVHTGVEKADGSKDSELVAKFVEMAQESFSKAVGL